MTLRDAYEASLIECNKVKAPSVLLEDFVYLFNKAIQQYINSVYNRCEYNQQSSDDLGFLQTIEVLQDGELIDNFGETIWRFELPKDYLHMLGCKAQFSGTITSSGKCNTSSNKNIVSQCSRLTANLDSGITNNYYMKPSPTKPYYYIVSRNVDSINSMSGDHPMVVGNANNLLNYNGEYDTFGGPTDHDKIWFDLEGDNNQIHTLMFNDSNVRTPNRSTVYIEIHAGNSNYNLDKIQITYLKSPVYVSMTHAQLVDELRDTTQELEFPDYVCYEVINIYVRLLLENASDPRLQTNIPINQTIAVPGNQ